MKMYFYYIRHQFRISMQYRSATWMMIGVGFFASIGPLFAAYLLFQKFVQVDGYTFNNILFTFSIAMLVFSCSELLFRGFDLFDQLIIKGDLDQLLIRPRGMVLQILGYKMEFGKIGKVLFSAGILAYAVSTSGIVWTPLKIFTLMMMIVSGVVIFLGTFMLAAGVSIFTISGNEFVNIVTNGGREVASYPIDIFHKVIKNLFTYIIPLAFFNYIPLRFLLDSSGATIWGNMMAPVYGLLFIVPCYFIFKWTLKHYSSSGT